MGFWGSIKDGVEWVGDKAEGAFDKVFPGAEDRLPDHLEGIDRENFNIPGFEGRDQHLGNLADRLQNRSINTTTSAQVGQSGFRGDQSALINQLAARARGELLSALQSQQLANRNLAQQQALAASARPGNSALAARQASQQAGSIGQGLANQTLTAGIQERNAAQGLMGNVLGQARGQDLQRLLAQANLDQNTNQFNVDALLRSRGINDQAQLEALRQQLQGALGQQQGGIGYEGNRTSRAGQALGVATPFEQAAGVAGPLLAGLL